MKRDQSGHDDNAMGASVSGDDKSHQAKDTKSSGHWEFGEQLPLAYDDESPAAQVSSPTKESGDLDKPSTEIDSSSAHPTPLFLE
jgi:hypothetical protein